MEEHDIEMHEQNDPQAHAGSLVEQPGSDEQPGPELDSVSGPSATNPEMPREDGPSPS